MLMYAKYIQDKCSAVAEMGDRLTTIDIGRKEGAVVPFLGLGAGSPSNTMYGLGRGVPQYQVAF